MRLIACLAIIGSLVVIAEPAIAGGGNMKAIRARTFGICKSKIDAKKLKGDDYKAAWKACKVDPDNFT